MCLFLILHQTIHVTILVRALQGTSEDLNPFFEGRTSGGKEIKLGLEHFYVFEIPSPSNYEDSPPFVLLLS